MRYDPDRHHRHSIRLRGYDYSREGAYFITICVHNRECLLGEITDGTMILSEVGQAVEGAWLEILQRFAFVVLDAYVLMPNHLHAILLLTEQDKPNPVGVGLALPGFSPNLPPGFPPGLTSPPIAVPASHQETQQDGAMGGEGRASPAPTRLSLGSVVGAFKSISARQANRLLERAEQPFWQRNYYEHIIRDEQEMEQVRAYIHHNPAQWITDAENPDANMTS